MNKLESLVQSLLDVKNSEFIKNAERRLNFVSGTLSLNDLNDVDTNGATSGQVLKFDGAQWEPGTDNT